MSAGKANNGNFFEDFEIGQRIVHATPRTMTHGDVAVYASLYGSRFAVHSSDPFARSLGYDMAPLDDLLVFHVVFGKTVPDISLNAVANLGYAECKFLRPVYAGDTLRAESEVIGLKENSNGKTGVVYVRTKGFDQNERAVLEFARWVMVNKRDPSAPAPTAVVPDLADHVPASELGEGLEGLSLENYDFTQAGALHRWGDYAVGERIDHVDGMTLEEAEHQSATRLYQNTAKVHFNQDAQKMSRFGRRLVYGGVIISMARALSFNGLTNAFRILAINGGRHVAPAFAGDTIYAWSEVTELAEVAGRQDAGMIRLRTIATKDRSAADFPGPTEGGYADGVILDLDYWVAVAR